MIENNKLAIGFNFENEFGSKFSATTTSTAFHSPNESDIDFIGTQRGYYRTNDYIFMEDVNEEEFYALANFLSDLRHSKEKEV